MAMHTMKRRRLTVVVPCHNEAASIDALAARLQAMAQGLDRWSTEVLLVDDGSTDTTIDRIEELRASGVPLGVLRLSRNFGHAAAIEAGLQVATDDAVITMDGDLQHPPERIPSMLESFEKGADIVQMVRRAKVAGGKGWFSTLFYRVFATLSKTPIVPNAADFRLLGRRVVEAINRIPERRKFLRGLISSLGFKQVSLTYDEGKRFGGSPSYGFTASLRLATKALFDFSTIPLTLVFWMGLSLSVLSFLAGVASIIYKLIAWHKVVPGYTDIIVSVLFLGGCILASVGILGRYLIMILEQVRGRPSHIVMDHSPGDALGPTLRLRKLAA